MEDVGCPRCKTTKYRKANIKLLVNLCGHALCDTCVELLFAKGSGPCPECGIPLRRSGFRVQLFEDPVVEKEVDIRRKVMKDYCKMESEFESLRAYNDYLEDIETIVFNLVHNIDIMETNKRIDQYKKDNREQIAKARARMNPEILELEALLEEEKLLAEHRLLETAALEKEEKFRKIKTKEALIDDLMFSDSDAGSIVASHKSQQEKQEEDDDVMSELAKKKRDILSNSAARLNLIRTLGSAPPTTRSQFSTGIATGALSNTFLPVPKKTEEVLFKYVEPEVINNGPNPPSFENLVSLRVNRNGPIPPFGRMIRNLDKKEKAGGYYAEYEVRRALNEAFSDICFNPKVEAAIKSFPFAPTEDENDHS